MVRMSINPLSGNAAVLKKLNRTRVLNNLRHNGKCSRTNLAGMTGLDKKTITNICQLNRLYRTDLNTLTTFNTGR